MSRDKQIEKMAKLLNRCAADCEDGCICSEKEHAEALYNAGYRKTFTSELASDTQKAFKEGYKKAMADVESAIIETLTQLKDDYLLNGEVNKATGIFYAMGLIEEELTEGDIWKDRN